MATYAVADDSGLIVNRIVLDDPAEWEQPAGMMIVVETGTAYEIGGTYIGGVYTPPAPVVHPPPAAVL